ncbi:MAG: VWA domain-containing protein [Dehalococcoidia bacterium]|nr:VWA domain-containing protein [Dehalococcoidia bacterium]
MRIPGLRTASFHLALIVAVLAAVVLPGSALADGEIAVDVAEVDDSEFPLVHAVLTADLDGRPLEDIAAADLEVLESGSPARIESVVRAVDADIPLGLVLVIDVSGSMEGEMLARAKASAASLVESLGAGDAAAVLSFADRAEVVQPMTSDRAALLAAIDGLAALGNTTLYDAVDTAVRVAEEAGYARRAVVLLSDGQDFGGLSTRTREQSLEGIADGGALFYTVGIGAEIDRPYLEEVAARSGGRFFPVATVEEMAAVYESLQSLLRSQFVVTFESVADPSARERSMAVTVRSGEANGTVERGYTSRREAAPPPAATAVAPVTTPAVAPPVAVEAPAVEESSGLPLLPLGLAAVALIGAGAFVLRRRRPTRVLEQPTAPDVRPLPVEEVAADEVPPGRLVVLVGPSMSPQVELGEQPVTVGTASTCALRLPAAPGIAAEHARFWRRDGRPMVHNLDRSAVTRVNGRQVDWASLGEEDEVAIGPYVLRYAAASEAASSAEPGAAGGAA